MTIYNYYRIIFLLILIYLGSVSAREDIFCMSCLPKEAIINSNIHQITQSDVVQALIVDLDFYENRSIVAVNTPSLTYLEYNSDANNNVLFIRKDNIFFEVVDGYITDGNSTHIAVGDIPLNVFIGDEIGNISVWDREVGDIILLYEEMNLKITRLVYHPALNFVTAIYDNQSLVIVDGNTGETVWQYHGTSTLADAQYLLQGTYLILATGNQLELRSSETFTKLSTNITQSEELYFLIPHPQDNEKIFIVGDQSIEIWQIDVDKKELLPIETIAFQTTKSNISTATINSDGNLLLLVEEQRDLLAIDLNTGSVIDVPAFLITQSPVDLRPIYDVAFSDDGLYLAVATGFGLIFFVVP